MVVSRCGLRSNWPIFSEAGVRRRNRLRSPCSSFGERESGLPVYVCVAVFLTSCFVVAFVVAILCLNYASFKFVSPCLLGVLDTCHLEGPVIETWAMACAHQHIDEPN